MGTYCAHLVAVKFLFCYGRYFMFCLIENDQASATEAFNSVTSYLDDLLNIS